MTKFRDAKVEVVSDETLSDNWYHLRKVTFDYTGSDGHTVRLDREVYDRGNGATILLHDPKRDTIILVRQFRMPAYQNGHSGWLLETPAGLLDGDHPADAIRREGKGGGADHEHEDIEVVELALDEAARMIETGEICDGKTIMLVQWALARRG